MTTVDELQAQVVERSQRWFPAIMGQPYLLQLSYMAHGLTGEAGEVSDNIKKLMRVAFRKSDWVMNSEALDIMQDIRTELGDVLVYLLNLCELLGADIVQEMTTKAAFNETRNWRGGNG